MVEENKTKVDVKEEARNMFNEFTVIWTRLVQVIVVFILATLIFMVAGFSLVPGISEMLLSSIDKTILAEGNLYVLLEVWALPSLFVVIILSVGSCILVRQIWRKSDNICIRVRDAIIKHHEERVARAQIIRERNEKKSGTTRADKRKEK